MLEGAALGVMGFCTRGGGIFREAGALRPPLRAQYVTRAAESSAATVPRACVRLATMQPPPRPPVSRCSVG